MTDPLSQSRRNVILFWVHIAVAALILSGFIYSLSHR